MSTYYLGHYSAGYTLAGGNYLKVGTYGEIGGSGLSAAAGSTTVNTGLIEAMGATAGANGSGSVTSYGQVFGGSGGPGGNGRDSAVLTGGTLGNDTSIFGGAGAGGGTGVSVALGGSQAETSGLHGGNGGVGGYGGGGVVAAAYVYQSGLVQGGAGGTGGDGGSSNGTTSTYLFVYGGNGGQGGAGGAGINLASGAFMSNNNTINGGAGGNGGSGGATSDSHGFITQGYAGLGGAGGVGVIMSGGYFRNLHFVVGGATGNEGAAGHQNSGAVKGGAGVDLSDGGILVNKGSIIGGAAGTDLGATVLQGDGIDAGAGAAAAVLIVNKAGAGINGHAGVADVFGGGVTLNNYGLVSGVDAVDFTHANDRLIDQLGSTLTGSVLGGGGTLELVAGAGTIGSLGGTITGFGTYLVDVGASWTLAGANTIAAGATVTDNGTLTVAGYLDNIGVIDVGGSSSKVYVGLDVSGAQSFSGGGTVSLSAMGYISGLTSGDSLTNGDTITGGGFIRGPLTLTNNGIIDNNVGRMILNTGNSVVNNGVLESTGTGLLLVRNTTIDSSGGGQVIDGKEMQLDGSTLKGGSLTVDAGALLLSVFHGGTVNLGGGTVVNAGTIEGAAGGLTIAGDVDNTGLLQGYSGKLIVTGAVTGGGKGRLWGKGDLEIDGAVSQNIFFAKNSTGTLTLADITPLVNGFTGKIYGLSKTGLNSIDLTGIVADGSSYKGTLEGGVLTLTDSGTTVATLKLMGDFRKSTFVLTGDGGTGTLITDQPKTAALVSAMAGFGAAGASSTSTAALPTAPHPLLASPSG